MQLPTVVVFGEALTDVVQHSPGHWQGYPGGAPWNVARAMSRLGVPTAFAGSISTDSLGDELAEQSKAAGLDMRFLQRVDADPLVAIVPSSHPPRYFFAGEADLHFDVRQLPEGWLDSVELCHFSCISLARQPLGDRLVEVARMVKKNGKIVSYDPNWRNLMDSRYREVTFPAMVELADIIKLSDEDLRQIYPGLSEEEALEELRGMNAAAQILFTRGAQGMVLFEDNSKVEQAAIAIQVADTVGAGDASMAGWLASSFLGIQESRARLEYSAACASVSCMHSGAYAPSREEVTALLSGGV
ncbi:carbohydrate kinase family protein [Pseudomonas viridiflava]|uniref:carbohydrate kinase family protein n=1 Tax=Pseudomonas viridiflava TaxID=33069 RepID=UPI001BCB7B89|nr:carbohydrate kinase [Pseudomonas viridiflava]QVI83391.1 carbohydrate kinase [Pseudomonas viridiflava]